MLQKLACDMAIIQNSGSKCTSVCIQTKSYMYVSPLYIYSIYPLSLPLSMSSKKSSFLSGCSVVIPNAEQGGRVALAETTDKPKFVS